MKVNEKACLISWHKCAFRNTFNETDRLNMPQINMWLASDVISNYFCLAQIQMKSIEKNRGTSVVRYLSGKGNAMGLAPHLWESCYCSSNELQTNNQLRLMLNPRSKRNLRPRKSPVRVHRQEKCCVNFNLFLHRWNQIDVETSAGIVHEASQMPQGTLHRCK